MHEFAIASSLVHHVEREARRHGAIAVHRVHVRIGECSGVEPVLLATAFAASRERTMCEGAQLDIEKIEAAWTCPECGKTLARRSVLRCPTCDVPSQLAGGDEILLDQIEMEVSDVRPVRRRRSRQGVHRAP